jgi:hypothetical protein
MPRLVCWSIRVMSLSTERGGLWTALMCARPAITCPNLPLLGLGMARGITQVLVVPPRVIAPAHVERLPVARIGQTVNLVLLLVVGCDLCAALKRLDLIVRPLSRVHDVCLSGLG